MKLAYVTDTNWAHYSQIPRNQEQTMISQKKEKKNRLWEAG